VNWPHSNERFIYDDCKTSFDAGLSDVTKKMGGIYGLGTANAFRPHFHS
jgi:hypothetical protein